MHLISIIVAILVLVIIEVLIPQGKPSTLRAREKPLCIMSITFEDILGRPTL